MSLDLWANCGKTHDLSRGAQGLWKTHRALVGLLSGVDSHVDQQFVAGVEWLVPPRAPSPEAGKVFPFALVYVHFLYVPHKFLLLVIQGAAVDPATAVLGPHIIHVPILLQSQCLGMGHQLLVVQVRVGMVGGRGTLGLGWQRRQRRRRGQV